MKNCHLSSRKNTQRHAWLSCWIGFFDPHGYVLKKNNFHVFSTIRMNITDKRNSSFDISNYIHSAIQWSLLLLLASLSVDDVGVRCWAVGLSLALK
jgi:hypothetical protein